MWMELVCELRVFPSTEAGHVVPLVSVPESSLRYQLSSEASWPASTVLNPPSCSEWKRPPGNNPCRDYCLHLLNHAWRLLVTVGQRQLQPFNSNNKGGVPRPKNVPSTVSFPQTFPSGDIQTEHIQRTQVLDGDFSEVFASWLS